MEYQHSNKSSYDGVLSSRTTTALKSQNLRTFRELASMNRRDLFKLPMIGKLAMREIDRALHERGLSYADGPAMIPTELFNPDKPKRGRPSSDNPTSSAERMRAKRERDEAEIIEAHEWHFNHLGMSNAECCASMARHAENNDNQAVRHAWLAIGRREGWI